MQVYDERPGTGEFEEDVEPGHRPVYEIDSPTRWMPDDVMRLVIVVFAMTLLGLALLGLFVLTYTNASSEHLLAWQGGVGTVGTLTAAITTYFFTRPPTRRPPARPARREK